MCLDLLHRVAKNPCELGKPNPPTAFPLAGPSQPLGACV